MLASFQSRQINSCCIKGSDAATAVNVEKEHHEKQTQHTLLLAVLEVSWSRWTFAMNQISYAFETCNDSRFSLQCIAITNNESLYKFAYKSSRNKSVPYRCPLHFADGKAATQIISFNVKDISVDYVGIMLADTNLRPHRASSRIESNVHFPIFIETMQRMKYDSAMPSIVNQNYLPYQRPRPSCQARSALFGDPQLIVYDSVKFRCFQSHIRHHISYHREISTFAALFYSACNASVGIMDQHHTGHAFINTQI